ncbi:PucR family transcriptional regulator [Streptomyces flavidovirens]|uniref:PucR family transcriptional regulator n=1 Tax=Streptomyces flavidovirens TaxID=67298 RepID=UPI0009966AED|nr:helix-turn-helix domain-containing protein [Streptomyces flavidovirens]
MPMGKRSPGPHAATPGATVPAPDTAAAAENNPPTVHMDSHLEQLASISVSRQRLPDEELEGLRQLAAAAAGRGMALRVLVAEYLASACRVWTDLPGSRQAQNLQDLKDVASALIRAVSDAAVALTEGYETAHRAAVRGEEATRREFVDDLLEGRTDLGRLAERAERFGLRLVGPHSVAVARVMNAPLGAGDDTTRYVEEALTARFSTRNVLITTKDGLLVCISPGAVPEVPEFFADKVRNAVGEQYQIAISRPRPGPSGIVRSYQEARRSLDLAALLCLTTPIVRASDLLVFQVLGRDRAAITDLVATVLGGLEEARGGPKALLETLTAYFASGCLNTTTARRLGVSVRTVTYRLTRIRQLTGHDPTDPDERYILQTAALGARLLGWPSRSLQPAD